MKEVFEDYSWAYETYAKGGLVWIDDEDTNEKILAIFVDDPRKYAFRSDHITLACFIRYISPRISKMNVIIRAIEVISINQRITIIERNSLQDIIYREAYARQIREATNRGW